MAKTNKLSQGATKALEMLKEVKSATAYDLKEKGFTDLNPAHLTALTSRGYATSEDTEIEVVTVTKRKVKRYTITELGENLGNDEGEKSE